MSTSYSFFKAKKNYKNLSPKTHLDQKNGKGALYPNTVHWYEIGTQNSSLHLRSVKS